MALIDLDRIRVGCSGWQYAHWRGDFYPAELPTAGWFGHYARTFDTVEINNSFYRWPPPATFDRWRMQAPPGFVYAVKASRFLTHMKKLKDPETGLARLIEAIGPFGTRLGPVLFQLPPRWHCNAGRLDAFLDALPPGHRYAFEFRDPSWHCDAILALLRQRNAAFCIFELASEQSPRLATADFVYVRLHGPGAAYQGRYHDRSLQRWAQRIEQWCGDGIDVYCYFDNDEAGYAFENARRLAELVPDR